MIKITKENAPKIAAEIARAQARCRMRLGHFRDVERAVELAEKNPVLTILPKAEHVGTEGIYYPGERPGMSYNGIAEETCIEIVRRASGWFFVRARRLPCACSERCNLRVPPAAIESATRRFVSSVSAKIDEAATK